MSDLISREALCHYALNQKSKSVTPNDIMRFPSAEPDFRDALNWLLAYHIQSFDLHGRYLPKDVIAWLINDFTHYFIAEGEDDETD